MPRVAYSLARIALATVTIGLAAGSACAAEGAGPTPGDIGQAVAAIVIFLVLLVVLGKYGWKPIMAQLRNREESIAKAISDAQSRQQDAEKLLAEYRARLDQVGGEAKELLAKSRQESLAAREQILNETREEARKNADITRQDIERAKQDALKELYQTTAQLAADMAARVLAESLKAADHRELLADSLAEIRKNVAKDSKWPKS